MKGLSKFITTTILVSAITASHTAFAAPIPPESAPETASQEVIAVTENLIGGIFDEVKSGTGYYSAAGRANTIIRKAVIAGETSGYGYYILSAAAQDAIRYYRDLYLRPEFYQNAETAVNTLISDLIEAVQNGSKDYETAKSEAYIRIYQSVDKSYMPDNEIALDICYMDIPAVDAAYFTMARKLLLNAAK